MHSIATGNNAAEDVSSSFFGNVNDQVLSFCAPEHQMETSVEAAYPMTGATFALLNSTAPDCSRVCKRSRR